MKGTPEPINQTLLSDLSKKCVSDVGQAIGRTIALTEGESIEYPIGIIGSVVCAITWAMFEGLEKQLGNESAAFQTLRHIVAHSIRERLKERRGGAHLSESRYALAYDSKTGVVEDQNEPWRMRFARKVARIIAGTDL